MSLWSLVKARWGSGAGEVADLHIDKITDALNCISYEHHEIHEGDSFTCHYIQTVSDQNDRTIIAFKTPSAPKRLHLLASASSTALATAIITEAPTITNDQGTTLAVFNRNRVGTPSATTVIDTSKSPDAAGSAMYFSETDMGQVTGGTPLATIPLGATAVPRSIGGLARATQEWVLKADTLYAFEVISGNGDPNTHWVELDWYEHSDSH